MKPGGSGAQPPGERFLTRWSRLKRTGGPAAEAAPATPASAVASPGVPPAVGAQDPAPAAAQPESVASLPPIESLSIESDFAPFFQPRVPEALRRAAVKKLFADPRFNVMDGLDVYIDDYSKPDPIPPEMMKILNHARDLIDHPSNRIEREQAAAAAGEGSAPVAGIADSAAVEPASAASTAESEAPPPAISHRTDATIEPAEDSAQSRIIIDRPGNPG